MGAAEIRSVNFFKADLTGAKFRGTDLRDTDFSYSNLSGAIFCSATLSNPNFEGANVEGADFSHSTGTPLEQISKAKLYLISSVAI